MSEQFTRVDLTACFNNIAWTTPTNTRAGALNVWRNSLPADELPSGNGIRVEGVPFDVPPADGNRFDDMRCNGQFVTAQASHYDWIYLLCAGERRVEDEIALHFTDGAVDFEPLRVSDYWVAPAIFGETAALTTTVMHYPHHVQPNVPGTIWCQRVPVVRRSELRAVRFPENQAIHVFAMTLCGMERRLCDVK
jgi:hypothetical protein